MSDVTIIRVGLFLASAAALAAAIGAPAAAHQAQKPPAAEQVAALMAKGPGELTAAEEEELGNAAEATMERVCILCHPFENIIKTRRTVREWSDQVTAMTQRGAVGTDKDFALVKRYLARWYGVVPVNTATAQDLMSVLGLSSKDATAIVEYRKANGNFTDLASLVKVEGVDKAKLEEQPEALRFK